MTVDWVAVGIAWAFSTITNLIILLIFFFIRNRSKLISIEKSEGQKIQFAAVDNFITNPFSNAYLEWEKSKPISTSSPKFQRKQKTLMPLLSGKEEKTSRNFYNLNDNKNGKIVQNQKPNDFINESKKKPYNNSSKIRNEKRIDYNHLKTEKPSKSKIVVDLEDSPMTKRKQNFSINKSYRSTRSDSQERSSVNVTKESNLTNSQKNSEKQLYFVKCGSNCSRLNCHPTKTEKVSKFDSKTKRKPNPSRLTHLPPRPNRQSSSMVLLKDASRMKSSLKRCHSHSPPNTPSPTRKTPSIDKLHTLHLKVDELCYTSLPTFNSPISS